MTIAIVGHRPVLLDCGYDETHSVCQDIKNAIEKTIEHLFVIASPPYEFIAPMCMGVCMWGAEIVLQLKRDYRYKDIKLTAVIPYKGHIKEMLDDGWRCRYELITESADEVITLEPKDTRYRIEACNRFIIDNAGAVLAVLNNAVEYAAKSKAMNLPPVNCVTAKNGTAYAVRYALQQRKPVNTIDPKYPDVLLHFKPMP